VRFLASEDAGYVTGTTLYVDGGISALTPHRGADNHGCSHH
jgi:NAD(P)-dependent dehydrogenase (short-subunit alcohol dehydrogenase family)